MHEKVSRKDVIILSVELECPCGRTKERAHCPICGKVKLYGMAETSLAIIPSSQDIVYDAKNYRCSGCGEKFNDVDWYFSCNAPKKIDFKAMKEKQQNELKEKWFARIRAGEKFDYNTRAKCRAETGFDPVDMQQLFRNAKAKRSTSETRIITQEANYADTLDELENVKAYMKDHYSSCVLCQNNQVCEDNQESIASIQKLEQKLKEIGVN